MSCSFAGSNRPCRKLGANPTQERCCKEGVLPFEKALLFQPLEYFREGWVCVLIAKSEYDCKMHGKISLRSQGIFLGKAFPIADKACKLEWLFYVVVKPM